MKVLILSDGIPPFVIGGMQKHSKLMAKYLAEGGHEVILYHYAERSIDIIEQQVGFGEKALENLTFRCFLYKDERKLPGHYLRAQKQMSQQYLDALRDLEDIDFIYAKGFMAWRLLEDRVLLGIKTPVGVKFHGMNMFQKQPNWRGELLKYMLRPPVRKIMRLADVVFSYGGRITDVIEQAGVDSAKIIEIPSGIERDWIRGETEIRMRLGPTKFLFVGRYDRLKGLPELYEAISKIKSHDNWTLTIVGPIPEKHKTNHQNVAYLGELTNELQLQRVYDDHDVLVCPSISEGMPNVILEAMARGLAILSSDVGASAMLVKDDNGVLTLPGNADSIRNAIENFIRMPIERLLEMKVESRKKVISNFLWENIGIELSLKINQVING